MVLGMSLATFTLVHVLFSLIGLVFGFVVVFGMIGDKPLDRWTSIFLTFTVLTSASGFLFPFEHLLPSHIVGIISLIALSLAILGRYVFHMSGAWRLVYVISAIFALYLNTFVAVVQSFLKVPALHALAPMGKEPPFLVAQLVVMAVFIVLGIMAVKNFHSERLATA